MKMPFGSITVKEWRAVGKFLGVLAVFCGIGYEPARDIGLVGAKQDPAYPKAFQKMVIDRFDRLEKKVDTIEERQWRDRAMITTNGPVAGGG